MKKSVMIGMSGGVDSSVAAAVLLEKGYEVVGVTLKLVPDMPNCEISREDGCCSLSAIEDARRVADMLGISYYVLNFTDIFDKEVIQYFVNEYTRGRTPNPCIACNRYVKFDHLLKKATSMGIDYIATGHYAKIEYNEQHQKYLLKKSVTQKKDQTYALYNLNQEQLSRTLMPIGDYTKEQVREMAEKIGLNVASKPDSQEICFVEDNNHGRFISDYTGNALKAGNFVDINGYVLGQHKGIVNYTIGQRKGLGIALGKPVFVIGINPENNTVILGEEKHIFLRELVAEDINIISGDTIAEGTRVMAKIRYSAREAAATLSPLGTDKLSVVFDEPQRAITPGQSIVFYNGDEVLGGGVIK